jgi:hypothetical protein
MPETPAPGVERRRLRSTLIRVLIVQAITLALLWAVHVRYHVS